MFSESYLLSTSQLLEEANIFSKKLASIKGEIKDKKCKYLNMKSIVDGIYKSDPYNLANEVPDIGEIVRLVILVGVPFAINPLLGIFSYIADRAIKDAVNVKYIDKYIKKFDKEIAKAEKAVERCKNKDQKRYLEEHLSDLQRAKRNLESKKYELEDDERGAIYNAFKSKNDEMGLNEAVNIMLMEYSMLTDEQKLALLDESSEFLSEAIKDNIKQKAKNIKYEIKAKANKMDRWFQDMANDIKHGFTNSAREDIIEQNIPKFSKMVKRAIIIGATWAVNPAIAVIGAVTAWCLSKKGKETQRQRILRELNNELELVEEKIKDADANSDKKQKYELMRLRQTIQNNRDKIRRAVVV